MKTIYQKLKGLAAPIVEHYKRDLTEHDRKLCAALKDGNAAFWAPRQCGTEWTWLNHPDDSADQKTLDSLAWRLEWFNAVNRAYPGLQWYLVESTNGQYGHVATVSTDFARDRLQQKLSAVAAHVNRAANAA